jgi:hypothetical protein
VWRFTSFCSVVTSSYRLWKKTGTDFSTDPPEFWGGGVGFSDNFTNQRHDLFLHRQNQPIANIGLQACKRLIDAK